MAYNRTSNSPHSRAVSGLTRPKPGIEDELCQLTYLTPHHFGRFQDLFDSVHHHFQCNMDGDGPDAYFLACEVEELSRHLHRMYKMYPMLPGVSRMADEFKLMSRDVQTGFRRQRSMKMSWSRFLGNRW
jgi:hypothetical protein